MDDDTILFSPYNWGLSNGTAKTINPGAYFRVVISGQTCRVHVAGGGSPMPSQFWTRVDGGPLQQHVIAPGGPDDVAAYNVSLGPPYSASARHLLEVVIKSSTETQDRWERQSTAVIFHGIELDAASAVPLLRAPARNPYNILIYGDSITEGVRTLGYEGISNDTDRNDAVRDYSYQLAQTLPAEVGVVAFGATGLTQGGSGAVPALGQSWQQQWAGEPRALTPAPDLVVYNEGTNDGARNITQPFLDVVRAVRAAAPTASQLLLLPFNGGQAVNIKAVVKAAAADASTAGSGQGRAAQVLFGDTSGFYDGADGLHPFGYAHVSAIAPRVAELCLQLLLPPTRCGAAAADEE
eukprot:g782.t1